MSEIKPFKTVSPGAIIQKSMEYMGWNQTDLSQITGLVGKTISLLVQDKQKISPDIAIRLGNAFGKSPDFWLNLSAKWQISKEENKVQKEELIKAKAQMYKYMPVNEIKNKGWFLNDVSTLSGIQNEYERLFGTKDFPEKYYETERMKFAARQTRDDTELTNYYRTTWFSFAKLHAKNIEDQAKNWSKYDAQALKEIAENLYEYTTQVNGIEKITSDLKNIAGVQFFVLSHLSKTYLDGAAFLQDDRPFIVYTGRYDREDNFWFVIAHEIAHILHHYDFLEKPFLDNMDDKEAIKKNEREAEADKYANMYLHKQSVLRFASQIGKYVTEQRIFNISRNSGVSVPVALGMMQHEGIVPWSRFSKYKPKVMGKIPSEYIKG